MQNINMFFGSWFLVLGWEARGLGLPASLLYAVTGPASLLYAVTRATGCYAVEGSHKGTKLTKDWEAGVANS